MNIAEPHSENIHWKHTFEYRGWSLNFINVHIHEILEIETDPNGMLFRNPKLYIFNIIGSLILLSKLCNGLGMGHYNIQGFQWNRYMKKTSPKAKLPKHQIQYLQPLNIVTFSALFPHIWNGIHLMKEANLKIRILLMNKKCESKQGTKAGLGENKIQEKKLLRTSNVSA
ncbi:unnamed protein product [Allacma fusca]|uniref:Uncharacterized protein n=1 Tax=Allacma fusca TaxID=39272 RepID=A0A8J2NZ78_9HEXA|nr:unnamed protein product [Allacma fusca]